VLDATIAARFGNAHEAAARGELFAWRGTPAGRLAEIVVLDQFSRNIHRDTARAWATDGMALVLAQEAITAGAAAALQADQRAMLYMPFMHSESAAIHEVALTLYAEPGLKGNFDYERKHAAVIREFGRYPHRNAALGRVSTPAELTYLGRSDSGF
ncbi:MAG: DUF924 domain-containing protein, partial [Gammaproteobacteria bacterium]|nr:DUF924 domain-containing protein [Gammaproteobacteria bacterium]